MEIFQAIMNNYSYTALFVFLRVNRIHRSSVSPRHNVKARNVSVATIYLRMHGVYRRDIYTGIKQGVPSPRCAERETT